MGNTALRIIHAGVWIEHSHRTLELDSPVKSKSEMLHVSCISELINSLNQPQVPNIWPKVEYGAHVVTAYNCVTA